MVIIKAIVLNNCRLCHSKPGECNLDTNPDLKCEISDCLQIDICGEGKELLPYSICNDCELTIKRFTQFKKHVTDIDKALKQIANQKLHPIELPERVETVECREQILSEQSIEENAKYDENPESPVKDLKNQTTGFLCVTCGKSFKYKSYLVCHENIHLKVKRYHCAQCDSQFTARSNLRAHQRKYHEGIRYYCSQCPKTFKEKSILGRHEKIHVGIKDFKCDKCTAAFYTHKELVKHSKYHEGLRLHKCDECFKSFFERHHLLSHLRTHTGEKPFVCTILNCGKSFTERQKLKRHHKARHS